MITKVSYGRTFNTGNYTSERYDLEYEVESETQDLYELMAYLKKTVLEMYRQVPTPSESDAS